jgi:hypothetical protein
MSITYKWSITQIECYPEYEGHAYVVFTAYWRLDGESGSYKSGAYGSARIKIDTDKPFTPYPELTEVQVVGWVKDALGGETVANYEANIARQINEQINPPVVRPPLPWGV